MAVHLTEANEDYIEAIVMLSGDDGAPVRSVDLARHMGVSKPSINKAVSLLRDAGLVTQEPYGDIYLTDEGRAYGAAIYRRHVTLIKFLEQVRGVSPEGAEEEGCRIEHTISSDTFERWTAFTEGYLNLNAEGKCAECIADAATTVGCPQGANAAAEDESAQGAE